MIDVGITLRCCYPNCEVSYEEQRQFKWGEQLRYPDLPYGWTIVANSLRTASSVYCPMHEVDAASKRQKTSRDRQASRIKAIFEKSNPEKERTE